MHIGNGDHLSEAYDDLMFGRGNDEGAYGNPFYKTCKYCGQKGLMWGNSGSGYRLFDKNLHMHECPEHPRYKKQ